MATNASNALQALGIRVPQQGLIDKLKHKVKVVLMSEYMTSQMCSTCESKTTNLQGLKTEEERQERLKREYQRLYGG